MDNLLDFVAFVGVPRKTEFDLLNSQRLHLHRLSVVLIGTLDRLQSVQVVLADTDAGYNEGIVVDKFDFVSPAFLAVVSAVLSILLAAGSVEDMYSILSEQQVALSMALELWVPMELWVPLTPSVQLAWSAPLTTLSLVELLTKK